MLIIQLLLIGIIIAYIVYGILRIVKNKELTLLHKAVWIIIIIFIPVLGTSIYLRTTFIPRT